MMKYADWFNSTQDLAKWGLQYIVCMHMHMDRTSKLVYTTSATFGHQLYSTIVQTRSHSTCFHQSWTHPSGRNSTLQSHATIPYMPSTSCLHRTPHSNDIRTQHSQHRQIPKYINVNSAYPTCSKPHIPDAAHRTAWTTWDTPHTAFQATQPQIVTFGKRLDVNTR